MQHQPGDATLTLTFEVLLQHFDELPLMVVGFEWVPYCRVPGVLVRQGLGVLERHGPRQRLIRHLSEGRSEDLQVGHHLVDHLLQLCIFSPQLAGEDLLVAFGLLVAHPPPDAVVLRDGQRPRSVGKVEALRLWHC